MVNILTNKTLADEFPTYLIIVSTKKMEKYLNSKFKWWKRHLLETDNIWLMDEKTTHPNVMFLNNDKKYETIYKRMRINDDNIYVPIEDYSKFYLDHKIKICTIIVEMLGVITLNYSYSEFTNELIAADSYGEYGFFKLDTKTRNEKINNVKNHDSKIYDKGECPYLFCKPDEFENRLKTLNKYFMDIEEYDNDFDLRNLVRSRLVGNLSEYTLKYEIEYMNSFEIGLTAKFYVNAGFNFKKMSNKKLNVLLNVKFYRCEDLINSENMRVDDNHCLQLILKGPSPINYYKSIIGKTNTEKMIQDIKDSCQNITVNIPAFLDDSTQQSSIRTVDNSLLSNFIDKYIEEKYKQKKDNDDIKSYYAFYNFIKIAKPAKLDEYMKFVKNLDDLDEDGVFFLNLRSTAFASLLPFNDDGLARLQKIYLNIFRQYSNIENTQAHDVCYNLRCTEANCNSPYRHLKRIFVYIIRAYNNASPDSVLTVNFENDSELCKTLHHLSMNIVIMPNYAIFQNLIKNEIDNYRKNSKYMLEV